MVASRNCVRWSVRSALVLGASLAACSDSVGVSETTRPALDVSRFVSAASTTTASDNAYTWLKSRMVSTGLVDSFQDSRDICYTYDQAVAAIAFQVKGDAVNARKVLDALKSMQYADGSWNTAYYCTSKGVQETQKHVGPVLWIAMAVAYYEKRTGDTQYHAMGDKAVLWSRQFQQADGGLNGGLDYNGSLLTWASTEHNEDAYSAFTSYGYTTNAAQVKTFLDNTVWDAVNVRWYGGRNDARDPMDVNSWGVSALGASGTRNYQASLDYVMTHHRSTQSVRVGPTVITVDAFDFNSDKNDIWFEGTGQMIVAFKVVGRTADADYFTTALLKGQQTDGGVQYSLKGTDNGYWIMSKSKSAAATGWLILAIAGANPFKP